MPELTNLHVVLLREFDVSCDMIKLAIDNMDATIWSTKKNDWSYVLNLYHIIDTIEFYSQDKPKNLVKEGGLGIHAPDKSEEEVNALIEGKTKEFFHEYLEKVRNKIAEKIKSFSLDELFGQDSFAEWGFTSRYHKYSYTLRHSMLHTGELNKTLRDLNRTRIKWL